ncbi:hypothetical protein [Glycomyces harbinensis]|uniref:Uncharacterized protein n=1 Tax=Glycomyces harbinensis TaxID=58114 RepID=A0A1G6YU70_9ACTN|nr:hypothetical protein [Glycomyces harbinensis]SDD93832.1 hypothetical protein SAMN05216270_109172 [Glycomyces harbinensis]
MHSTDHATADAPGAEDCDHQGAREGARFCASCGATLTTPDAAPVTEAAPAGMPRPARRESPGWVRRLRLPRRIAVPLAVVAVVAVAGVGGLYIVQGQRYSPEEPARELIAALEDGDGRAVAAILGVDAEAHPLLAAGALDSGYEPPTNLEVLGVAFDTAGEREATGDGMSTRWTEDYTQRPDMEHATVTIGYELAGEAFTVDLDATREGSGWARPWALNPAGLETTVRASGTAPGAVQLAAVSIDADPAEETDGDGWGDADEPVGLLALPGVYTATAPGDGLWTDAATTVTVPLGEDGTAVLSADIRPEAEADTLAAVVAHVDACAAAGGYPDAACGWRDDTGWMSLMPDDATWTVETYPSVEVEPDHAGGLEVHTTTPGVAVAKYDTVAGETRTITAEVHANGYTTLGDGGTLDYEPQACDIGQSYC